MSERSTTSRPGGGSARKQSTREAKAAKMRAEAARKQAQRRTAVVAGVVLAVIAIVVAVFVVIQGAKRDQAASAAPPANIGANDSIVVGDAGAKVTLIAYEDFQCPICQEFEKTNATQIAAWVKAGTVKVEYRPIAFLDRSSTTKYSTRALNAVAAVVNADPSKFPAFHQLLFANQPAEGSAGLTDAQLASMAAQAGASESVVAAALKNKTYEGWAAKVTEDSNKAGVTGTPTVKVNGTELTLSQQSPFTTDPSVLKKAVEAAAK